MDRDSINGLDALGGDFFGDIKKTSEKVPWGDVGRVASKIAGGVVNVYVPGAGTALSDVADQGIDMAEGKKPAAQPSTAPSGTPPKGAGPATTGGGILDRLTTAATPAAPPSGADARAASEAQAKAREEATRREERNRILKIVAISAASVAGAGVLGLVLWRVLR